MEQPSRAPDLPCPVGPAGRAWIEARLGWIAERFGVDRLRGVEVALPAEVLGEGFDGSPDAAVAMFERLRGRLGLAGHRLRFGLYDEEEAPALPEWAHDDGERAGTAGHFVRAGPGRVQVVRLNASKLDDPMRVVATLVHELCHVLLIGQDRLTGEEADQEPLTDLLAVFLGFGVFTANSVITERSTSTHWSVGRLGYLRQEELAYALALLARLRGEARPAWAGALCTDVRAWLDESLAWLTARGWGEAELAAARRAARRSDALDFEALWAGAAEEAPAARARLPWGLTGLLLGLLGLCLTGALLPPWLAARARPLHVVNATPWPAAVMVDASAHEVAPGARVALEVGDGRHAVVVRTPRGEERLEVTLEPPAGGAAPAVTLINVLGAAAVLEQTVLYGAGVGVRPPPPKVHRGETLVVIPGVDDPFRAPPERVSARAGARAPPRRCVSVLGEGSPPAQALGHVRAVDPAAARELLALQRGLRPGDPALVALEDAWRDEEQGD